MKNADQSEIGSLTGGYLEDIKTDKRWGTTESILSALKNAIVYKGEYSNSVAFLWGLSRSRPNFFLALLNKLSQENQKKLLLMAPDSSPIIFRLLYDLPAKTVNLLKKFPPKTVKEFLLTLNSEQVPLILRLIQYDQKRDSLRGRDLTKELIAVLGNEMSTELDALVDEQLKLDNDTLIDHSPNDLKTKSRDNLIKILQCLQK